ncbi:MAG TPA: MerR family transcriptional regulator [Rhizomicrobium sp.]|nr:MerR family transcriptional regulator [Rhizomicrobium sp.]
MSERYLSSAETAKRLGLTPKALRLYEARGLVTPTRSEVGWRSYGPAQIARLHQIIALKKLGLSLSDISDLLTGDTDKLNAVLALQERALARENQHLSHALVLVRAARKKLAHGSLLSIDDLIALALETTPLTPLWEKHFTRTELDEIAGRIDDEIIWHRLLEEVQLIADKGDPFTSEALDLGRRWLAQADHYVRGDKALLEKMQAFSVEAMADPEMRSALPLTPETYSFLGKIITRLKAEA